MEHQLKSSASQFNYEQSLAFSPDSSVFQKTIQKKKNITRQSHLHTRILEFGVATSNSALNFPTVCNIVWSAEWVVFSYNIQASVLVWVLGKYGNSTASE